VFCAYMYAYCIFLLFLYYRTTEVVTISNPTIWNIIFYHLLFCLYGFHRLATNDCQLKLITANRILGYRCIYTCMQFNYVKSVRFVCRFGFID